MIQYTTPGLICKGFYIPVEALTSMFTAVMVPVARQWDQSWCLYIDELLIKM